MRVKTTVQCLVFRVKTCQIFSPVTCCLICRLNDFLSLCMSSINSGGKNVMKQPQQEQQDFGGHFLFLDKLHLISFKLRVEEVVLPPDPITYLLQSNQLTKGHSHLPTEQLIKSNQSFSSFSLPSLSINECLNCDKSQGSSVCFPHPYD